MRLPPRMWRTVRSHALYFHSGRLRQQCVCERHPKIRIGFLESGGGWIVPWFDRMDRHFDDKFFNDSKLETRPPSYSYSTQCHRNTRRICERRLLPLC